MKKNVLLLIMLVTFGTTSTVKKLNPELEKLLNKKEKIYPEDLFPIKICKITPKWQSHSLVDIEFSISDLKAIAEHNNDQRWLDFYQTKRDLPTIAFAFKNHQFIMQKDAEIKRNLREMFKRVCSCLNKDPFKELEGHIGQKYFDSK